MNKQSKALWPRYGSHLRQLLIWILIIGGKELWLQMLNLCSWYDWIHPLLRSTKHSSYYPLVAIQCFRRDLSPFIKGVHPPSWILSLAISNTRITTALAMICPWHFLQLPHGTNQTDSAHSIAILTSRLRRRTFNIVSYGTKQMGLQLRLIKEMDGWTFILHIGKPLERFWKPRMLRDQRQK